VTAQGIAGLVRAEAAQPVTVSVFATGLYNPRGLKFGPDGNLYVAEGGKGGTNSTIGKCEQVPAVGPYTGSPTGGRISKISPAGVRSTVTSQLPSSQTSAETGSLVSGVADVAFIGHTLYAILAGGGCSHGVIGKHNAVLRIGATGSAELEVRALSGEAWARAEGGEVREAVELLLVARELAEGPQFSAVDRADILFRLGVCRYKLSSIATAASLFDEALALAGSSELPCDLLRADILGWRSRCLSWWCPRFAWPECRETWR